MLCDSLLLPISRHSLDPDTNRRFLLKVCSHEISHVTLIYLAYLEPHAIELITSSLPKEILGYQIYPENRIALIKYSLSANTTILFPRWFSLESLQKYLTCWLSFVITLHLSLGIFSVKREWITDLLLSNLSPKPILSGSINDHGNMIKILFYVNLI